MSANSSIYLGIFKGFGTTSGAAAAFLGVSAPLLALTGGLALACFVKVYGCVFLGEPRRSLPEPHDPRAMNCAMAILSGMCILVGLLPFAAVRVLEPVLAGIYPEQGAILPSIQATAHLYGLSLAAAVLIILTILLTFSYLSRLKARPVGETGTWDCGYAAPGPSMQYTASSFAEMLGGYFRRDTAPERHQPEIKGLFPGRSSFRIPRPGGGARKGILPFLAAVDRRLVGHPAAAERPDQSLHTVYLRSAHHSARTL